MTTLHSTNLGLEPIGPTQRMIGLLLALRDTDEKPVFTYESLADRLLEEASEKPTQEEIKSLSEQLRRIHRGEIVRTRPMLSLYSVFSDELTHELVHSWYISASDALERLYLLEDGAGLKHQLRQIDSAPSIRQLAADEACHSFLKGRVGQFTGENLAASSKHFQRAEEGFSAVFEQNSYSPYLRYQRLLAMEARLNTGYRLRASKDGGEALYVSLVDDLLTSGMEGEVHWALEAIAPSSRRAYLLAEMMAPVAPTAAAGALRQAVLIDPSIAHFDLPPFPGEEAVLKSRFLGPVAEAMEDSDADLLKACRELTPRGAITEPQRTKFSRQVRAIYHQASSSSNAHPEGSH